MSKARENGICDYRLWTTEELVEAYAYEWKRINQTDRETTQKLIKAELRRRFNATLHMLDDDVNKDNPHGIYRYLLGE